MKTNINLSELVDAFRAQHAERLEAKRIEEEDYRNRQIQIRSRNLEAIESIWPQIHEIASQLPGFEVLRLPSLEPEVYQTAAIAEFAWRVPCKSQGLEPYTLSRVLQVWNSDSGEIKYALHLGRHGGYLAKTQGVCDITYNPADVLVAVAALVGKSLACQAAGKSMLE